MQSGLLQSGSLNNVVTTSGPTHILQVSDLNDDNKLNIQDISLMLANYTALEVFGDPQ